jgi:hypothetical protein
VFTSRCALSPYVKQTRFVFKGLIYQLWPSQLRQRVGSRAHIDVAEESAAPTSRFTEIHLGRSFKPHEYYANITSRESWIFTKLNTGITTPAGRRLICALCCSTLNRATVLQCYMKVVVFLICYLFSPLALWMYKSEQESLFSYLISTPAAGASF